MAAAARAFEASRAGQETGGAAAAAAAVCDAPAMAAADAGRRSGAAPAGAPAAAPPATAPPAAASPAAAPPTTAAETGRNGRRRSKVAPAAPIDASRRCGRDPVGAEQGLLVGPKSGI
mmetsp:Transcript_58336/g.128011  ORF Transcript_58336/g.128011 Transcript_58336/m.128011 type:complete len:118 (+) Transcript_58336:554-907(+)